MKYQLILQWPSYSIDCDSIISIEESLIENLSNNNDVDGHDIGAGEANIFILTNDPEGVFAEIRALLENDVYWPDIRAAYRDFAGAEDCVLWPKGYKNFKIG
ncbi:hypothetical protein [Rhodanobacter sp. OK091]|uniref:hypothetical protein n=1 Tax=Rhodanobacter sp. OK091 TaxID=1881037 RepID=UPI0009178FF1|nr:hypothetical protein [Rhodanobacter sp. OK091]SHM47923.1 hypothetical protein SAMN05428972_3744 [Rhodanobacter sp. OK091]